MNDEVHSRYLRGANLIARKQDGQNQFYHFNAHGDVVQRTDSNGVVLKNYEYDAFGVEFEPEAMDANPFRYCGEYWDRESKTVYLRARSYNPSYGRFTSEDPARDGQNWYAYCGNNPVAFYDPSGTTATRYSTNPRAIASGHYTQGSQPSSNPRSRNVNHAELSGGLDYIWWLLTATPRRISQNYTAIYYNILASEHFIAGSEPLTPELSAEYMQWASAFGEVTAGYMVGQVTGSAVQSGSRALRSFRGGGAEAAGATIPAAAGEYLAIKAPNQITPGISQLKGQYIDDLGRVQPWTAHYDEYGRLLARTDFNAGNMTAGIPNIHYHTYEWGRGKTPLETGSHIEGVYKP